MLCPDHDLNPIISIGAKHLQSFGTLHLCASVPVNAYALTVFSTIVVISTFIFVYLVLVVRFLVLLGKIA